MTSALDFYPFAPTGLIVELDLDGDGVFEEDVTPYLRGDAASVWVAPERGQQAEGAAAPPAQVALRFDNADRRFSPRAPGGAYYGRIGRNTPCRLSLPAISSRLEVAPGAVDAVSTTSSTITASVTDLDVRVMLEPKDWRSTGDSTGLVHQWVETGNKRRWLFSLLNSGRLAGFITTDGTTGTQVAIGSTAVVPQSPVRQALRLTVDWNNGAGGSDWKFWTAPTLAGPWTQLGATVTAAVLAPAATDVPIRLGDPATAGVPGPGSSAGGGVGSQTFLGLQVYNGRAEAGGTLLVDLDLTDEAHGATSITDATGFGWTIGTGAAIDRRDYLMTGTVPDWQTVPGLTDDDCEVTALVSDDLRRVSGTNAPIGSAYRRGVTSPDTPMTDVRAYWPLEEPNGATSFSSALPNGTAMRIAGDPALGSDSTTFPCSDPLPVMSATAAFGSRLTGMPSGVAQVRFLLRVPPGGIPAFVALASFGVSGSASYLQLALQPDGTMRWQVVNDAGTIVTSVQPLTLLPGGVGVNGKAVRIQVSLSQVGADVKSTIVGLEVGASLGNFYDITTAGETLGALRTVTIAETGGLTDCTIGHLSVQGAITDVFEQDDQLNAYIGETAPERVARLCSEAHLPADVTGYGGPPLGAQRSQAFVDLLREAEFGDSGILHSPRGSLGFAYRSLTSTYSRDPALTGAWSELGIVPGAAPVDDDRYAANDVTLSRPEGEYFRAVQSSGAANVQDPPLGIGRYEVGDTKVSAASVEALAQRTTWELHLGTVDEPRITGLTIDLGSAPYVAATPEVLARADAVRRLDVGDRILITDMPTWWGAPNADLIVIGLKPEVGPWYHRRTFAVRPRQPFHVLHWSTDGDRLSAVGTVTAEALDTTETAIDITPPDRLAWGHGDGDYEIVIDGEVMTVTGVTDLGGGDQRLDVVRSVNGVVKTHDAGALVDLADPCYLPL